MNSNEDSVRRAYAIAEAKDIQGWIDCFVPEGSVILSQLGILSNLGSVLQPLAA